MLYLYNADPKRYKKFVKGLEDDYMKKLMTYPKILAEAQRLMMKHSDVYTPQKKKTEPKGEDVAFTTRSTYEVRGKKYEKVYDKRHGRSNTCGEEGHHYHECKKTPEDIAEEKRKKESSSSSSTIQEVPSVVAATTHTVTTGAQVLADGTEYGDDDSDYDICGEMIFCITSKLESKK